ncbi:hypothetical protein N9V90_02905 [Endozoicomonas sp.]|nr:hypothetical protein [Endozoicomonas sp.]
MHNKTPPPAKAKTMDFAQLLATLEKASPFDLFRLQDVIDKELESYQRIQCVKEQLTAGQQLSYFNTDTNRLHPCEIIKLKQKNALVIDFIDKRRWNVRYYMLNIEGADCTVNHEVDKGLSRHALSVNDVVGLKDKHGIEHTGQVIRLNPKSVTLICADEQKKKWRVSYALLYRVLDGSSDRFSQSAAMGDNTIHPSDSNIKIIEGTVIQSPCKESRSE